jgi:hypothetical protein
MRAPLCAQDEGSTMQHSSKRKAVAKTERIDARPAIAITALSVLASLLVATLLFL